MRRLFKRLLVSFLLFFSFQITMVQRKQNFKGFKETSIFRRIMSFLNQVSGTLSTGHFRCSCSARVSFICLWQFLPRLFREMEKEKKQAIRMRQRKSNEKKKKKKRKRKRREKKRYEKREMIQQWNYLVKRSMYLQFTRVLISLPNPLRSTYEIYSSVWSVLFSLNLTRNTILMLR